MPVLRALCMDVKISAAAQAVHGSRSVTATAIGFGCWGQTGRQLRLATIAARRSLQSVVITCGAAAIFAATIHAA